MDGTGFLGAKNHYSTVFNVKIFGWPKLHNLYYTDRAKSRVGPINISISKHVYDPEPNFIFDPSVALTENYPYGTVHI